MKVNLQIELDLPDHCKDWSDGEIEQLLFDEYINYVICAHLLDALKWMTQKQEGAQSIADHHNLWADIGRAGKWKWERQ